MDRSQSVGSRDYAGGRRHESQRPGTVRSGGNVGRQVIRLGSVADALTFVSEVLILRGPAQRLQQIAAQLKGRKGIFKGELVMPKAPMKD